MEAYLDHLSAALAAEDHSVRVVTRFVDERPSPLSALFRSAEPPRTFPRGAVDIHVIAPTRMRRWLLEPTYRLHHHALTEGLAIELYVRGFYDALFRALEDYDVVHFSGTGREMLGFAAARVADDLGVPFVVTPHMHVGSWGDGPFDFRLYRDADAVIALTEFERSVLLEGDISPERVHVQGHGVNVSGSGNGATLRTEMGLGTAPMILFLGRKSTYKGFPLLLSALPSVWTQHPEVRLVVAGPEDPTLTLSPEAEQVLNDDRVTVLGFVSDEKREDLYAACDIFCLPSEAEAFGLVYVEAGSYGKPVVALDIPTLHELIGDAGRGLLASPTPEGVSEALLRLLNDPSLQSTLGRTGRHLADKQQWSHVAENMASIYRNGAFVRPQPAPPIAF
jgi:glycosyltransferase involved in cell wall biosynthesis